VGRDRQPYFLKGTGYNEEVWGAGGEEKGLGEEMQAKSSDLSAATTGAKIQYRRKMEPGRGCCRKSCVKDSV
jgi:hypothetical protein